MLPNETPQPQPPAGIEHHYCRLALVQLGPNGLQVVEDCRPLFPPLTEVEPDQGIRVDQGIHVKEVLSNATNQPPLHNRVRKRRNPTLSKTSPMKSEDSLAECWINSVFELPDSEPWLL